VVLRHAPDFDAATMVIAFLVAGKYLSLTCTINATSGRNWTRSTGN
jgi:putative lipoic acid-binding regulatory protein